MGRKRSHDSVKLSVMCALLVTTFCVIMRSWREDGNDVPKVGQLQSSIRVTLLTLLPYGQLEGIFSRSMR